MVLLLWIGDGSDSPVSGQQARAHYAILLVWAASRRRWRFCASLRSRQAWCWPSRAFRFKRSASSGPRPRSVPSCGLVLRLPGALKRRPQAYCEELGERPPPGALGGVVSASGSRHPRLAAICLKRTMKSTALMFSGRVPSAAFFRIAASTAACICSSEMLMSLQSGRARGSAAPTCVL